MDTKRIAFAKDVVPLLLLCNLSLYAFSVFGFIHENAYLVFDLASIPPPFFCIRYWLFFGVIVVLPCPPPLHDECIFFFETLLREQQKKRTTVDQIDPKVFVSRPRFSVWVFLGRYPLTRKSGYRPEVRVFLGSALGSPDQKRPTIGN